MYDSKRANDAINFIQGLKHTKGEWAGKPFKILGPEGLKWQRVLIKKLFGTVDENGYRIYRICYVEIPKKNGKSELAAAIALYLLFGDYEIGAEIYSAATDREQAAIVFNIAAQMVRMSPGLLKRCKIIDSQKRIVIYSTNSFYRVLSREVKAKHGFNTHGVIFDELHAQPDRDLWDVLTEGSGLARRQPLIFVITMAGYDRNSICWEIHDYALKVKNGIIKDKHFLPMLYSLDENEDWEDETNWYKVNPSLDHIIEIERFRDAYKKTKEIPARINIFRRIRLNQWTQQETRWIPIEKWDACPNEFEIEDLKGKICYGGLDLSATTDLTAFSLIFPGENNKVITYFFIPEERMMEIEKKDRVPYSVWARQGFLNVTNGNVIDYFFIENKIKELAEKYQIKEIAYDRWNADMLVQRLIAEGFINMIPIGMGFASMNAPTKYLEALILDKKINHGGNPILRWNFDNVMITQDPAGNIKPDKAKSTQKIDGIVSLILAIDRTIRHEDDTKSIYDKRGILTI